MMSETHCLLGVDLAVLCFGLQPGFSSVSWYTGGLGSVFELLDEAVDICRSS